MIASTSRRAAALLCLACALLARPASAQSGEAADGTTEEARALYVEGRDLRRQGELEKSLEKFQAAYALHPTSITALEVGRGRALTGKLRAAIEVLDAIERMPARPNESDKAAAARAEAKELAAQIRARTPALRVLVEGAGARVWVDGEAVPTAQLEHWLVDPGTHHVEAAQGERRIAEDVHVLEGEERAIVLRLSAASPQAVSPPGPGDSSTAGAAPEQPASAAPSQSKVLAYLGFGIGGVGLVTGTVTGILTISQAGTLKPKCQAGVCPPDAGLDSAQTLGTVSTISFVVGGAGVAMGIAALVVGGHGPEVRKSNGARTASREGAWVRAWFGIAGGGVEGVF
jgi:hypothetical protein